MGIDLSKIKGKSIPSGENSSGWLSTQSLKFYKSFISKKLNDGKKEEFYSELFLLLQSGLDLKRSLEIFSDQQSDKYVKSLFKQVEKNLVLGDSFSGALQKFSEFSPYEFYSIKIGEESGQLLNVLSELGSYYQRKLKQHKQLVSALMYPTVILLTAIIAVGFMMNFIVPLFADAFKRFNSELPSLTILIVKLSMGFRSYWWISFVILGTLGVAIYFLRKNEAVRMWFSEKIIAIPLIGTLLKKIYLARFCQSMALMVSAHTPMISSLDLVGKMVSYLPLEKALEGISQEIYNGKMLNESMASISFFEQRMISLIKVGEETNKLDVIFKKLYDQYIAEADHSTRIMNSLAEPILIVLVGSLVAIILIAMYLPMFKIGNSMI
jgi:type IV pilus assembly protein PilC